LNPKNGTIVHLWDLAPDEKSQTTDSGLDFSAYTTVIREFYAKHPEYQNIPKSYLMSFLTNPNFKTADELYEMAVKGEMRIHF
jgi:hypothetical protein